MRPGLNLSRVEFRRKWSTIEVARSSFLSVDPVGRQNYRK